MNKTLIIGDIHLGKGSSIGKSAIDGSLNSRISDQINILNWVLNTAVDKEISRLILTGDIFEEIKPDHQLVMIFMDWLTSCSINNIEVHIVAGNHDLKRVGNKYSSILDIIEISNINHIYIYNKIHTIHTNGVSFTFLPFRNKSSLGVDTVKEAISGIENCLHYQLADIPFENKKVLVGHVAIENSVYTGEIGDNINELLFPISSFVGYDYVWMGHIHKPQVMNKSNPYVAHIGSMDISDFGETDQKKIAILFNGEFEELIIPTRPLKRIKIEVPKGQDGTDILSNYIKTENFTNAIVKIEVKLLDPEAEEIDREYISELLYSSGAYYISSFSESKTTLIIPEEKKYIKDSAINPQVAIKLYADSLEFDNEDEKNFFIKECLGFL